MLKSVHIQRYKSLYDVSVELEPLTVLIGPNGSGKSSFCDVFKLFSDFYPRSVGNILGSRLDVSRKDIVSNKNPATVTSNKPTALKINPEHIFWHGEISEAISMSAVGILPKPRIYNFIPSDIAEDSREDMSPSGNGIANLLARILFDDRGRFSEMEQRFVSLVPNIAGIKLDQRRDRTNILLLKDKFSDTPIPANHVSDGTLRILAFLAALYDVSKPDLICFEEPENGIHPWLLNKLVQIMQTASTEGINGKPTQIIITTHSPVMLNYVEPCQIRAVELDAQGATQIRKLPTDTKRFQAAMDAYDNELGELWFTNILGANPA